MRQVTIPLNGARLIIASDGLWDAVQHKTIISNVGVAWGSGAGPNMGEERGLVGEGSGT